MRDKKCVFPGSFNPFTSGHEDIVLRAMRLFDEVRVLIASNPDKPAGKLFERAELIRKLFKGAVRVDIHEGLTADYCKANDVGFIVRGIRNAADYCYECDLARINGALGIETVLLTTSQSHISSSYVRELIKYGADIKGYVPADIADEIYALYKG